MDHGKWKFIAAHSSGGHLVEAKKECNNAIMTQFSLYPGLVCTQKSPANEFCIGSVKTKSEGPPLFMAFKSDLM